MRSFRLSDTQVGQASTRRSSLGVPLSSLIFPRSATDRHESHKLQRAMEEKYGFHYFTNAFCLAPIIEMDYQAFYTETNINPACYASMFSWLVWILLSIQDTYSMFSDDAQERHIAQLRLLLSGLIFIPVPFLVLCARSSRFQGHEQLFLCAIVHCFAIVIMAGGVIPVIKDYRTFLMKDLEGLLDEMSFETPSAAASASVDAPVLKLDGSQQWWDYEDFEGTGRALLLRYVENVVLPIAHLNINLLRPLLVLVIAPMFKLDPSHYIVTTLTMNISFCLLVSVLYPQTRSVFFIANKFLLIFCLVGVSVVMVFRVRQTDRFLRFNFLHAKTVEDRARASQLQREIIINENKSLKKMLEERNRSAAGPLDLDSPMAKVIMDLKNLQRTASLSPELRENLDGIVMLLSKKGQNLFAPDIHEQLKQKKGGDLDGDTKSWAATVLTNKSYTRNRRASAGYVNSLNGEGSGSVSSPRREVVAVPVNPDRYIEARLHPEVSFPTEEGLNAVAEIMERDGWSVDTFVVAEMTDNRPISFITYIVFEQHNLFELCSVNKNTLVNFLYFLDIGYHRNPYHNNCHAADVVSSVEYLISVLDNGFIQDLLTHQEILAATIAAAIHDFRHPGKTNNFMVKSGSDFAIEYSDSSVLERMHLAEAFFLLRDPLFNIFSGMSPPQVSDVRKAIVEMVLSTDLSVHLQLVGSLKTALISQETSDIIHSPMMVMKIVIKCADLGHSSKALKLHARWSDMIIEEFFLQGDEEQMLGMDISPFMNRNSENSAKNQVGFFEFIILPFYEVVAEVIFRAEFKQILDQAHQNYKQWKKAEGMQINSIKDILDQIFDLEGSPPSQAPLPAH
ncbi:hypothetical protein Poli38472_007495 [Pythium oligandrum]|uniref:Phosphodiesterase n=1 Tax=Pythium oligandrum TaxID=41045 RepID=A0A8K1CT52_PYTOL|nr:hypothetical protein Poli38472_007495 [Pythium oligandrum]|eukprot:TMW67823.1 hypothetical protein Poli38472_007495 [Pythium oligandrum]